MSVRKYGGHECRVVFWVGMPASAALAKAGPREIGGLGDARLEFDDLVASGIDPAAAGVKVRLLGRLLDLLMKIRTGVDTSSQFRGRDQISRDSSHVLLRRDTPAG
jgi:hypothetical protein